MWVWQQKWHNEITVTEDIPEITTLWYFTIINRDTPSSNLCTIANAVQMLILLVQKHRLISLLVVNTICTSQKRKTLANMVNHWWFTKFYHQILTMSLDMNKESKTNRNSPKFSSTKQYCYTVYYENVFNIDIIVHVWNGNNTEIPSNPVVWVPVYKS